MAIQGSPTEVRSTSGAGTVMQPQRLFRFERLEQVRKVRMVFARLWFRRVLAVAALVSSVAYFQSSGRPWAIATVLFLTVYTANELAGPHERP